MEIEVAPLATSGETEAVKKTVYLSLGSNLGDRAGAIAEAIEALGELGTVKAVSSFYETEPVDFTRQPWFLNAAVAMETDKLPRQLLAAIHRIEAKMGRKRKVAKGPRVIDIDILMFGSSIIESRELTVPHAAMHERRFVLEPLAEIAPDLRHPVLKKTVHELRDALPAGQAVRKIVFAQ